MLGFVKNKIYHSYPTSNNCPVSYTGELILNQNLGNNIKCIICFRKNK